MLFAVGYCLVAIVGILACTWIGHVLLRTFFSHFRFSQFQQLFIESFIGLTVVTVSISLIRTHLLTIQLPLLLLLLALVFIRRKKFEFHFLWRNLLPKWSVFQYGMLVGTTSLFFLIELLQIYDFNQGVLMLSGRDILYYGNLSEAIWSNGIENNLFNDSQYIIDSGLTPYHYLFNGLIVCGTVSFSSIQVIHSY
ncbi:MAG: hypothetical protein JKY54_02140 [Flavobacteriales bacterium]|nr:hypothetical protein [Flavobacteriales bacterium]